MSGRVLGGGGVCGLNRVYLEAGSCILVGKSTLSPSYIHKSQLPNKPYLGFLGGSGPGIK